MSRIQTSLPTEYDSDASVFNDCIEYGIISFDSVLDKLMSKKKEAILRQHPYSITPPSTDGGRWQTCYRDHNGKKRSIKARSREELIDKLYQLYIGQSHIDKLTFNGLFEEWLVFKNGISNSPNTIKRHRQHYKRYLESSVLDSMPVSRIDELILETECNRLVKENNLTRKEWYNVKTILNGMFQYALRKKYLTENPMERVEILVKYRQVLKKTGKTETYNTEELKDLTAYLERKYTESEDTVYLAIRLNFLLGLRVGELVALKWSDHVDETHLHIIREEIRDQEKNSTLVVEHTKTNNDRFVTLVPAAIRLLERIPKQGEYIFMRKGERITSRQVAYVLEKYAERQGKRTKSTHKMRKTYASLLNANGVPLDYIREQLGHASLTTTLGYIYNPLTEKETYDLLTKALEQPKTA